MLHGTWDRVVIVCSVVLCPAPRPMPTATLPGVTLPVAIAIALRSSLDYIAACYLICH